MVIEITILFSAHNERKCEYNITETLRLKYEISLKSWTCSGPKSIKSSFTVSIWHKARISKVLEAVAKEPVLTFRFPSIVQFAILWFFNLSFCETFSPGRYWKELIFLLLHQGKFQSMLFSSIHHLQCVSVSNWQLSSGILPWIRKLNPHH